MKIGEMLQSLFGIDVNKEYIAEQTQNFPAAMNPPAEPEQTTGSTAEQHNEPQNPTSQNTTVVNDDSAVTIQRQQAEIEALKQANAALLSKTPIASEELSVEDMLYRAVIGVPQNQ